MLPIEFEEKNKGNEEYWKKYFPNLIKLDKEVEVGEYKAPVYDVDDYEFTFKTNPEVAAPDPLVGTYRLGEIDYRQFMSGAIIATNLKPYRSFDSAEEKSRFKISNIRGPEIKDKYGLFEYKIWHDREHDVFNLNI